MATEPTVYPRFESQTGTWQYVVADPTTNSAVIIDPVLDLEPCKNTIHTGSADALLALVSDKNLKVKKLLETHVHADHLTAAKYLQSQLAPAPGGARVPICIGKRITQVQEQFAKRYGIPDGECDNSFDELLDDDDEFSIGKLRAKVLHLPGHTPDHVGYLIGSNVFCGDSLFNADVGSARCDFPGGNANTLYRSVQKLLLFPAHFKIWTGHDYPPGADQGRGDPLPCTTVGDQLRDNRHLKGGTNEDQFVSWRREHDMQLGPPRLLNQSLQVNIRAGQLPKATELGDRFLHLPINMQGQVW